MSHPLRPLAVGLFGLAAALTWACNGPEDTSSDEGALIRQGQPPMSKARLEGILAQSPQIKNLDQLPAALPKEFLINLTLKHGRQFEGEHGHLVEHVVSQSSSPSAPRAILWDERSGLSVSYNGGAPGQTEPNRLDVLEFDDAKKDFHLTGLEFNGTTTPVFKTDAEIPEAARKCARCHGEGSRPIFSMYPDWPSFYGSDNDELTDGSKAVQARELAEFKSFKRDVEAQRSPRYLPLFDAANVSAQLRGTQIYPSYPYRQDTNTNLEAISRSFAFRPSLRLGVLMNRLMAQVAARKIEEHANFAKFGGLFLHDLLECRWPSSGALRSSGWLEAVAEANGSTPRTVADGRTLHYRDLLKLFGLKVEDIDIRYSVTHPGYANEDASNKVMEVGYIDDAYWNSYFDGSATVDELVSMHLYQKLAKTPAFRDIDGSIAEPDGLVRKYARRVERFKFDKNFFEEMDRKGTWIPIPYPRAKLDGVHHREGFPASFANQHRALCTKLEGHIERGPSSGGGTATACPASCVASSFCKDHANAAAALTVNGLPCMLSGQAGCQPCR
jgi:hypothetical protein